MPSTDFNGDPILILYAEHARVIASTIDKMPEWKIVDPPLEVQQLREKVQRFLDEVR